MKLFWITRGHRSKLVWNTELYSEEQEVIIGQFHKEKVKTGLESLQENPKVFNQVKSTYQDTIRAIEEDQGAEDISFLQNYKATMERSCDSGPLTHVTSCLTI
ncbi:hypothetical protein J4Q44_G00245930 [Coregonus suidteri]|uniref:Uncharacterized protein n=1 Tax=Coregonus suidteri TaxID=861788 RepID=A0AAN8LA38_9TELE